jgi:hypothetical protein
MVDRDGSAVPLSTAVRPGAGASAGSSPGVTIIPPAGPVAATTPTLRSAPDPTTSTAAVRPAVAAERRADAAGPGPPRPSRRPTGPPRTPAQRAAGAPTDTEPQPHTCESQHRVAQTLWSRQVCRVCGTPQGTTATCLPRTTPRDAGLTRHGDPGRCRVDPVVGVVDPSLEPGVRACFETGLRRAWLGVSEWLCPESVDVPGRWVVVDSAQPTRDSRYGCCLSARACHARFMRCTRCLARAWCTRRPRSPMPSGGSWSRCCRRQVTPAARVGARRSTRAG